MPIDLEKSGRVFSTRKHVNCMIRAGYHTVASTPSGKRGMADVTYRRLWPVEVVEPPECAGQFDGILLVDLTIARVHLELRGQIYTDVAPASCKDFVCVPINEDGTPLRRYIAFVQLGRKSIDPAVADYVKELAMDEVGLVLTEGLHLPVEYREHLRQFGVDLAGSAFPLSMVPCISLFGEARPKLSDRDVTKEDRRFGVASRSRQVIAVA